MSNNLLDLGFEPLTEEELSRGQDLTKLFEGYKDSIYRDTAGKDTIGYGFNLQDPVTSYLVPDEVKSGKRKFTKEESDQIFQPRYKLAVEDAMKYVGKETYAKLPSSVKVILNDMSYNLGYPKLTTFKKMRKELIKGDYQKAADEMKDSKWFKQTGQRGQHHFNLLKSFKDTLGELNPLSVKEASADEFDWGTLGFESEQNFDWGFIGFEPEPSQENPVIDMTNEPPMGSSPTEKYIPRVKNLEFRQAKDRSAIGKITDTIKSFFRESDEEAIAKAQNIYAISKTAGIPMDKVEKNIKTLARDSKITGIKPGTLTKEEYSSLVFFPFIGAGAMAAPVTTALSIGAFTALDKLYSLDKFLPSDASDSTRTAVELADFLAKGALVGGVMRGATKQGPKIIEALFQKKAETLKLPREVKLTSKQVREALSGEGKGPLVDLLAGEEARTGNRRALRKAVDKGVDIKIPGEKLVQMVDKPGWGKFKRALGIEKMAKSFPHDPLLQSATTKRIVSFEELGFEPEVVKPQRKPGEIVKTATGEPLQLGYSQEKEYQAWLKRKDVYNRVMKEYDVPLHPPAEAKAMLEKITRPFSDQEMADIQGLLDWEQNQPKGERTSYINDVGQREFMGTKSGHSEAMQEIGPKKAFELLFKAIKDENLTPKQEESVKLLLQDYRENIKPQIEELRKEIENAKSDLSEPETGEVVKAFEEEQGNVEYDWEGNPLINVYHGSKEEIKGLEFSKQESGYYPGFYLTSDINKAKGFGEELFNTKINEKDFYEIKDPEKLKRDAEKAGFEYRQGSGKSEVEYLETLGYKGIKRGNEYILFEGQEESTVTPSGQVRLELLPPEKKELFQDKGELFQNQAETPLSEEQGEKATPTPIEGENVQSVNIPQGKQGIVEPSLIEEARKYKTAEEFVNNKLNDVANQQRGEPEASRLPMFEISQVHGELLEVAGDLIHRMYEDPKFFKGNNAFEKIRRLKFKLEDVEYLKEQMDERIKATGTTQKEFDKILSNYANEYKKLPTYNETQQIAKNIPIAIAEKRYVDALNMVKKLDKLSKNKAEWNKAITQSKQLTSIWEQAHAVEGKGGSPGSSAAAVSSKASGYGIIEPSEKSAREPQAKSNYAKVGEQLPTREETNIIKEALKIVSPATVSSESRTAGHILRKGLAELAHKDVVAIEALKKAHSAFTWMNKADAHEFIDNMETGTPQKDANLQRVAETLRGLLDGRKTEVQNLGKGHLESFYENYFPHIWKDPKQSKNIIMQIMGRKRLEGSKSFLKKRVIMSVKDGLEKGLELVSDNPIDLVLLKLHEMDRYIMAQKIIQDMKARNMIRFVYSRSHAPDGYTRINDNAFTVYMPPEITKKEAFDSLLVEQLMDISRSLGIDTKRFGSIGGKRWGYATQSGKVRTKFAGPESVLAHEIGHILGFRYNLYEVLGRRLEGEYKTHKKGKKAGEEYFKPTKEAVEYRRAIDPQWRALADARQGRPGYVRNRQEKEAVMLEALIHAPDTFKKVAPDLHKAFTDFLNAHGELRPILDIKPSLVLEETEAKIKIPGFTTLGHYYAPDDVARLVNNHLSPGIRNNENKLIAGAYNITRGIGNLVNQINLSLSLFHALNVSTDMMASTLGLGLRRLQTKGQRIQGLKDIVSTPISPIISIWNGARIKKAYKQQIDTIQNPKLKEMVEAIITAGGRDRMDVFYYNQQIKALEKTFSDIIKEKDFAKLPAIARLPFNVFGSALEVAAKPIMEWYVPTGKIGLFSKLAMHEMQRAESGEINDEQLIERLTQVWDSVDNRMGQLIYDNIFWAKTLKDSLMLAIRSVGWNLGSWREYAGAGTDLLTFNARMKRGDKFFSHKMAYVIGAGVVYSILGATIMYVLTGKYPEELKDYFFPKTGEKNPDGSDERLSLPTYAKDIYAYFQRPVQTLKNKGHPLIGLLNDQVLNRDFFNVEIAGQGDPLLDQIKDRAKYTINYSKPFSFKNYEKMEKASDNKQKNLFISLTGITSAPSYITRSPAQKLMYRHIAEQIPDKVRTKEDFERSEYRKSLVSRIRKGEKINNREAYQILGEESYRSTMKEARLPPFAGSFSRLSFRNALNVYAIANAEERKQTKAILAGKFQRARIKTKEMIDLYKELIHDKGE